MARIRLVSEALIINTDNAIQYTDFLIAFGILTQSAFDLEFEGLLKLAFVPIECVCRAQSSQVIAMYYNGDAFLLIPEAAGRRDSSPEA